MSIHSANLKATSLDSGTTNKGSVFLILASKSTETINQMSVTVGNLCSFVPSNNRMVVSAQTFIS